MNCGAPYRPMREIKLNLGCGEKHLDGFINIDFDSKFHPDKVMDLTQRWDFEDNSVTHIYCNMVVEHINDLNHFFSEMNRVLKPMGTFEVITANNFYWKTRIKYLLGKAFEDSSFHLHHCWVIKPSHLKTFAEQYNFRIELEGQGRLPFPDLCYKRIVLKGRIRQ